MPTIEFVLRLRAKLNSQFTVSSLKSEVRKIMIHHASPLARVLHVNGLVKDQKRLKAIFNSDRGTSPPRGGLVWAETGLSCSGRWGKLAWFPCLACGVHLATSRWPGPAFCSRVYSNKAAQRYWNKTGIHQLLNLHY
ncbi:hypothetical protein V6N13_026390 [Hibiscus sabdariffa]